ncbi:hypothetical protein [Arthrobacter sp. H5]|uniref:hypothetical protein n=1 Tax=Arthrobacter sp. H5 TaxID=1267973 RepID=UPI0004AE1E78|nr:hypothetical protein [Arthrobacter sp. H5]
MATDRKHLSGTETTTSAVASPPVTKRLTAGVIGGLAGGAVFGALMAMMGMLPLIAMLVGSESAIVGLLVHLAISVLIGLGLTLLLSRMLTGYARAAVVGLVYGALWWVLGPLLLMPSMMGMPVFMIDAAGWMSLIGHLLYGVTLGVTAARVLRVRA